MSASLPEREIAAEMQFHPASSREAAWRVAEQALAVRRALLAEAMRRRIAPEDETGTVREIAEDSQIRRLIEEAVSVPDVTEEECRADYARRPERYRSPALYEAAHILIAAEMTNEGSRQAAREQAAGLIAILAAQPERFAALACAHSACPSKSAGGALGQVTARDIAPELASMLAAMTPGTLCAVPVPSRHGYHVLRLDQKSEGRVLPYEAVASRIRDTMRARVWSASVRMFISRLMEAERVS